MKDHPVHRRAERGTLHSTVPLFTTASLEQHSATVLLLCSSLPVILEDMDVNVRSTVVLLSHLSCTPLDRNRGLESTRLHTLPRSNFSLGVLFATCAVLYCTVPYRTALCCTILCCTVLCLSVQLRIVITLASTSLLLHPLYPQLRTLTHNTCMSVRPVTHRYTCSRCTRDLAD
jgi:hypothetical protein